MSSERARGFGLLREHLRQLRSLAGEARRGGFSLSHFKRIDRFLSFATPSRPLFLCVLAVLVALLVLVATGLLPLRVPMSVLAVMLTVVWARFVVDLIVAVWQRDTLTSVWMVLWVLGVGMITLATIRGAFMGA